MKHRVLPVICLSMLLFACTNYEQDNQRLNEEVKGVREENSYLKAEIVGLQKQLGEMNAKMKEEREGLQKKFEEERDEMHKKSRKNGRPCRKGPRKQQRKTRRFIKTRKTQELQRTRKMYQLRKPASLTGTTTKSRRIPRPKRTKSARRQARSGAVNAFMKA